MKNQLQNKLQWVLVVFVFMFFTHTSKGQIIISQVYEGASNNKWIEITNVGSTTIDLVTPTQYKVGIWTTTGDVGNAVITGVPSNSINLSGSLAPGAKYLIRNTSAAANVPHAVMPTANISNTTVAGYNGNDGLAIFTGTSTLVDAFGAGINNKDISYHRNFSVVAQNATFTVSEWTSKTLAEVAAANNTMTEYISTHLYNSASISVSGTLASLTTTYGTVSSNTSFDVSATGLTVGVTVTPPMGFEVSTFPTFSSNVGTNASPIIVGSSGTLATTTIYVRLMLANAGNYTGNVVLSSTGVTTVNVPTNATNTIDQKELTISGLTADDKVFDNNTTATLSGIALLNGIVSGDEPNVTLTGTPVANFNDATVGVDKPVTVTGYTLSGSAATNYSLTQPTGLTADITSSGLLDQTITFGTLSPVTYGDANFNLTATASSGLTVSYISSNTDVATILGNVVSIVGAGSTTITASQAGNLSYNPAASVDQVLVVNPKNLTVTGAVANDKEYNADTTASVTGGTLVGVINSDDVSFTASANFDDLNVGTAINVSTSFTLSGTDAANYTVSGQNLSADITPKELTIAGISISDKEYDTNNSATISGTATLSGVFFPDFSNVSLTASPVALFNDATVNVDKPVSVTGYSITGSASGNYFLTQPIGLVADITPKSLSIVGLTANDKTYDRTLDASVSGTASLSGIIPGDESNISLNGTPTAAFLTVTAGINKPVSVTGYTISGSSLGNYTLSPLTLSAEIIEKDVTISGASANDKPYDGTTTATLNGTIDGVISPDTVVLNLAGTFDTANVGTNKPVTSTSTLSGVDAINYNLLQPTGLTADITASLCSASTGNVVWNFTTATPSSNSVSGVTVSAISQGNNNGTTTLLTSTSASSGYAGVSGLNNAGAASFAAAFNSSTSTYFQFTITPNSGLNSTLNNITFGSRSTSTGPQAYTLRSSIDNFSSDVATGTLTNNSVWVLRTNSTNVSSINSAPVTFRLYGHSGTGSPSTSTPNWRIDDLIVNVSVVPGAALTSPLSAVICTNDAFNYTPATSYSGATITWTRAAVSGISNAAVVSPQTSNPSEVLNNTTSLPINVVYNFVVTGTTCFVTQDVTVTVNPSFTWYLDADNDNYYTGNGIAQCDSPGTGYKNAGLVGGGDCDDANAAINPGAVDVCYDGIDNDCNGIIDNACTPIISTIQATQCGITLPLINSNIFANLVAGAQGYRFTVTDMTTNQVQTIDRALRVFNLTQLSNYAFDRTYQVQVSIRFNNVWQPFFGAPCMVTTPATVTQIQAAQCDGTLTTMGDVIFANNVPFATGYRFRITNLLTSVSVVEDRLLRDIRLTNIAGFTPEFNTTYSVEVAIRNTNGLYLQYNPVVCNITTPSFPTTQLQLSQCDVTISNPNTTIFADSYAGATTYRFKFTSGAFSYITDRPLRSFILSSIPLPGAGAYSVQVSIEINGVFGGYGKICTLTIPGGERGNEAAGNNFQAIASPNPFASTFGLNLSTTSEEQIQVRVYDMLGKLVEDRKAQASDIIELGDNYPSGVYNVIVSQGENTKTLRVIKR